MAALSKARRTVQMGVHALSDLLSDPVAANTTIYQGSIVALNAGYAAPASTAAGLIARGVAQQTVINTAAANGLGANGSASVPLRQGTFKFGNSTGADTITQAQVGTDCFLVDDQTLAATNGGGTRSRAGKVMAVDPDGGVWVQLVTGI